MEKGMLQTKTYNPTNLIKYMAQAFRREKKHNQIDVATF